MAGHTQYAPVAQMSPPTPERSRSPDDSLFVTETSTSKYPRATSVEPPAKRLKFDNFDSTSDDTTRALNSSASPAVIDTATAPASTSDANRATAGVGDVKASGVSDSSSSFTDSAAKRQNFEDVSSDATTPAPNSSASPSAVETATTDSSMSDGPPYASPTTAASIDPNWPVNKPHVPGFHPSMATVEETARDIVRRITRPSEEIAANGYYDFILDSFVKKLTQRMNSLARSDESEIVALLGDMGIGKSEAYEALVGQDGIAIKSDSGRGTHFPIEGHGKASTQVTPFLVIVVWKLVREMQDTIKNYCREIFEYLDGPRTENVMDDEVDDSEEEADEAAPAESNGALERQHLFEEALTHLVPLLQDDGDKEYKNRASLAAHFEVQWRDHVDLDHLTQTLLNRITALRKKHGISASTDSYPANTAKEAAAIIENLSPPTLAQSAQLPRWERSAHLEKAQIHCDNDMGTEGIVFTDVPGRNDPDRGMSELIEDYVKQHAKRYLIMAPAGRPVTAESDKYLRDAIKSKRPTIFVVTKIDVKDKLSDKEKANLASSELEAILKAEADIDSLKSRRLAMQSNKAELEANGKHQEANALAKDITNFTEVDLHKAEAKLHQLRVETRNRKEEAEIHAQYHRLARSRPGSSDIQVVFISAKEYGKHRRQHKRQQQQPPQPQPQDDLPVLDYEATGIPKLFRLLYRDIASKRIDKLRRLCLVELPKQISAIQHVLNKTPVQRHQEFKDAIESVFVGNASLFSAGATQMLTEWLKKYITKPFKLGRNNIWPAAGMELLASWTFKVRAPTFHKFCKCFGDWRVGDREISWNADIQDKIAGGKGGVADGFNGLLEEIVKAQDNCCGDIAKLVSAAKQEETEDMAGFIFRSLDAILKDRHFFAIPESRTFVKVMKDAKLEFREMVDQLFKEYLDTVEDIRLRTILPSAGSPDGTYVGVCMAPTYEDAASVNKATMKVPSEPQFIMTTPKRGKPKQKQLKITPASMAHDKRKALIRTKLAKGSKSVFKVVHDQVEEDIKDATTQFVNGLDALFAHTCRGLLEHFDAFYSVAGEHEEEVDREMTAPLRYAVARVLEELPSEDDDDDQGAEGGERAVREHKGDLEKLLRECESWKTQYPAEQEG